MSELSINLTFDQAKALTEQIRDAVENVWTLLKRAHEGKAWAAIGYPSWEDYVRQEFQMSKRHAYRLLDYAEVREALAESDRTVTPTEFQARPLVQLETPEEQREAWTEAVEASSGKPTAKHVEAAVENVKSRHRPIQSRPLTATEQAAVEEAEKDSETLWLLKSYWKKANRKDKRSFIEWANNH